MSDKMLTIIMSNYNQEKYIKKAIDSVLMQNVNFKYELIITDDYSQKDNSVQIIKEYEVKYPEIIHPLYNVHNVGYLTNIIRAKSITKTPYFCLLDADDYYTDQNFLQRAYDFLQANNEYVIYYENVNYLYEDGSEKPFINLNEKSRSFDINDYLNDNLPIVQTTGQFYRNVIFSKGVPKIMKDAIGTVSERSFEGDYDRFVMHLKYGKAYFNNQICGIYRLLPSGIWNKLSEGQKCLLQLQTYYDYNRYYDNKYLNFFINKMYIEFIKTTDSFQILASEYSEAQLLQWYTLYNFLLQNKVLINIIKKKKEKNIKQEIKRIIKKMLFFKE